MSEGQLLQANLLPSLGTSSKEKDKEDDPYAPIELLKIVDVELV